MKLKHLALLLSLVPSMALAFCGFYVGGASSKLYNNATQVVLMRGGTRTVLSMQNNYEGPPENFAMVIPVPVVLQKENVKTLKREVFDTIDTLDAPRLVEYWEQDPCRSGISNGNSLGTGIGRGGAGFGSGFGSGEGRLYTVTIEAQFTVGEYEIVILSAEDSSGLEAWLHDNNYNIPEGAEPLLRPYVAQGSKFFVAKVDISKVKVDASGKTMLSPLRFYYDTETFSLPVRLGLINSSGKQDLIVHILAKDRYETSNYQNVFIPTNLTVSESANEQFGSFYAALFDEVIKKHPKSVVTEYAWNAASCDPCPGPSLTDDDVATFGGDVMKDAGLPVQCDGTYSTNGPKVTEGKATIKGSLDKDLIRRVVRRAMPGIRFCYEQQLAVNPNLNGKISVSFSLDPSNGAVTSAKVTEGSLNAEADDCVARKIKQLSFPTPVDKKPVDVIYPLTFAAGFSGSVGTCTVSAVGLTLTRLHTRYSSESLGEDLVFKEVTPVVGGREFLGSNNKLEEGAIPSDYINNFQARYIIRHAWKGDITCANPTRGVWGGPPDAPYGQKIKPARDLAFAKRDNIKLQDFLGVDLSILKLKEQPKAPSAKKKLEENQRAQGLPSFQPKDGGFSISWGFLIAAAGGLLLLLLVFSSRSRD